MQFRLALALSISVVLIGVASWYRFSAVEKIQPNIVAIEQPGPSGGDYEDILNDFVEPKTASTTYLQGQLNNTDLIGRQLILDYVGLAAIGQTTDTDIASLANQYIESIPAINKAAVVSSADIKTVSNTKANFQNYADGLTKIYREYGGSVGRMRILETNPDTSDSELYSAISRLSVAYTKATLGLKSLPVPASIVSAHLELLNSYLSSAEATRAISETKQDPAAAFAGLITLNNNIRKEEAVLNKISQILTSNGI